MQRFLDVADFLADFQSHKNSTLYSHSLTYQYVELKLDSLCKTNFCYF